MALCDTPNVKNALIKSVHYATAHRLQTCSLWNMECKMQDRQATSASVFRRCDLVLYHVVRKRVQGPCHWIFTAANRSRWGGGSELGAILWQWISTNRMELNIIRNSNAITQIHNQALFLYHWGKKKKTARYLRGCNTLLSFRKTFFLPLNKILSLKFTVKIPARGWNLVQSP